MSSAIRLSAVWICLAVSVCCLAGASEPTDVDELFQQARSLASEGRRDEARQVCAEILDRSPEYTDVKIFSGRLHAWDKNYPEARIILEEVLRSTPRNSDARNALIDVELWSDHPLEALNQAEAGLEYAPDNADHLYRKARALDKLEREDEALQALKRTLEVDPTRSDALHMLRRALDDVLVNKLSVDYEIEGVSGLDDDWHEASLGYGRRLARGSVLGRINFADRFGKSGHQYEIDAYLKLPRKTYMYLSLGYSDTNLFPEIRYNAEVYHNFRRGFEGSLGLRRLEFENSDVTIYTGTVAKYRGDYWISLRPNYVDKVDGRSTSLGLTVRRFLNGRHEYVEFGVSDGTGKDVVPTDVIAAAEEESLNSFSGRAEVRKRITNTVVLKIGAAYRTEDLESDRTRRSVALKVGLERYF